MNRCQGCGFLAEEAELLPPPPVDRHASPQCRQRYGVLLSRSYAEAEYRRSHQLLVDAYAARHPEATDRRQVQRPALCLMTLCLFVETGAEVGDGPQLYKRMMSPRPDYFHALAPPDLTGC